MIVQETVVVLDFSKLREGVVSVVKKCPLTELSEKNRVLICKVTPEELTEIQKQKKGKIGL